MPHITHTSTIHKCIGKTGGVTIKNKDGTVKSFIQAGNCRPTSTGWCAVHEHFCARHDWVYSKKDQCVMCQGEKRAKAEAWERNKHRKQRTHDEPRAEDEDASGGVGAGAAASVSAGVDAAPKRTPAKRGHVGFTSTKKIVQRIREENKRDKAKAHRRGTDPETSGGGE
ncbi:hypothetical protein LZ554_008576 [Drepanopeziza brunnea f. sp. 'monogermtubi']|nr:hypothetical protein LZ554_008576 [Drepanopeziza brunnea f. sp. 'monogermtubi']